MKMTSDMIEAQKRTVACKRCFHQWRTLLARPTVCPRCKSYKWDVARKKVKAA